eukprot:CAMPEP_0202083476 /NCGR_PEP_ID=MMETSP0964-20121228/24054_1 /ASSEMBLY_ACC=CAM_ASM_000500 /TAXON_ID=4773 /ORGANISM="Schizochytrium aggregatum, Strain ATCC28209" /LENGTH=35 /DNA_ID= /DNA_START= /DNA_END= /DNA_ORIENTATION=
MQESSFRNLDLGPQWAAYQRDLDEFELDEDDFRGP